MARQTDEQLIAQFCQGDAQAFDVLMNRYWRDIYRYAFRRAKTHEDAEDIAQEVFSKVYRALASWEPQASFKTWLYRIAQNVCTDHYRSRTRRRTQSLEKLKEDFAFEEPMASHIDSDPVRQVENAELHELITRALEELTDQQRESFTLYYYQHLQVKEIAEVLGIAEGTVKAHRNRAMGKLRQILGPYWENRHES